jgi:hypothetical protein
VTLLAGLILTALGLYAAVVAAMYLAQTRLVFPSWLAQLGRPELPPWAERLQVTAPDGVRLAGVRLPPTRAGTEDRPILLGFPGNAWNAEAMALTLHQLLPESELIVFHYRGYSPSGGRAGAKAILADALTIFDDLQRVRGADRSSP